MWRFEVWFELGSDKLAKSHFNAAEAGGSTISKLYKTFEISRSSRRTSQIYLMVCNLEMVRCSLI